MLHAMKAFTCEHSYHIDFGAKPATYVDAFMNVVCWSNVDRLLDQLSTH